MAPIGIGVVLILLSDLESGYKRLVNANKCKNKHIREKWKIKFPMSCVGARICVYIEVKFTVNFLVHGCASTV